MARVVTFLAGATCLFLTGSALAAQATQPMPRPSAAAEERGAARGLKAWGELCDRVPDECALDVSEPRSVRLDPATWELVATVNLRVNRAIRPLADLEHWGVDDRWDLADDGAGDCEDYALRKRRELVAAGLPRRALRMTVVVNENDEGHAVLTLVTDRGDLILDNRSDEVLPWGRTGYRFVKRESRDAAGWVYVGPGTGPALTATRRGR